MWAALPAHDRSTMDPVMAWCHCSNKPSPDPFYTKWYKQGPRSYAKYESPLHNTIGSVTNEWPYCQPTLYFTTHILSSSQCSHLLTPHSLLFYLPFVAKSHPRQQNRKAPIINMSTGIDIMSLNVGGLGNCTERKQLFEWIKNKKNLTSCSYKKHTPHRRQYGNLIGGKRQSSHTVLVHPVEPGGRLNKKDRLTGYGDPHVKDKTSYRPSYL